VPYMLVLGDKEQTAGTVSVRARAEGDLGAMPMAEFIHRLEREVREKSLHALAG
jgi:threonyl-tRNA synthetase